MQFETRISPQFDLCYALADLVSPVPDFTGWPGIKKATPWLAEARSFGWSFWLGLPDLIENEQPTGTAEQFLDRLAAIPDDQILPSLRRSLLHSEEPNAKPKARKREWLHFVGLEHADGTTRWTGTAARPLKQPLSILRAFAEHFDPVWNALQTQLKESCASAAELAAKADIGAVVDELGLALDIDRKADLVRALRGGFTLPLKSVVQVFLMPSPFNSRRLWNAALEDGQATLFLPYFMADASLPFGIRRRKIADALRIDPWLVCRAVGDSSRASILRLLAERPRSATELMDELGLSKATVSHHVFQLREAGLIAESRNGRRVELSIDLKPVRALSRALERELGAMRVNV